MGAAPRAGGIVRAGERQLPKTAETPLDQRVKLVPDLQVLTERRHALQSPEYRSAVLRTSYGRRSRSFARACAFHVGRTRAL